MDWKSAKHRQIAKSKRIVVKVGSAVLTTPEGLDCSRIEDLAGQMAALHDLGLELVLVTSGAVAAGRGVLRKNLISGLPDKQAAAAIGQSRLMHYYDMAFAARGKISAQVLLTREDLRSRQRFLNARNTFASLLSWRAIPVVNENDTVAVQELKFGDNDNLSGLLLNVVEADLFVNLTSAPGVFDNDPAANPNAKVMPRITGIETLDITGICGAKTAVGSGGMHSKLLAARRAAQIGVPTLIIPGKEADILVRAFGGEDIGTWIPAGATTISRRKFWLAYNWEISGTVTVDAGAATALVAGGKSLLPAGITAVEGNFSQAALVRITDAQGNTIGVGQSNYSAAELRRAMGRKLAEIAADEGCAYHEAIHRDNMLIDPAL